MPSYCVKPGCRFGANGVPASAEPGMKCCICNCEDRQGEAIAGKEKGALVKKLLKLKATGNDEIYAVAVSLAGPAVAEAVNRATSSGTKKQKLDDKKTDAAVEIEVEGAQPSSKESQNEASKRPESAASQQTLKAAELLNPLDQGSFGLCSDGQ